jgi:hypothetical protein
MPKNQTLRQLLPAENYLRKTSPPATKRCNVSIACTECQKGKTKVRATNPMIDDSADGSIIVLWYDAVYKMRNRSAPMHI